MPRNGSGSFARIYSWVTDAANSLNISSSRMDADTNDIAAEITNSIAADGQTTPTANLKMGGFKHTGAGSAAASGQYLVYGQSGGALTNPTLTGATVSGAALEMSAQPINGADRVDVASAGTVNLDSAAANHVQITGTTTITAITLSNGNERTAVFGGALTLTNGASLILPGGANITTAAGDTAIFVGEAAGVVRCINYTRTSGGSDGLLSIGTASAASTVNIVLPSGYRHYEVLWDAVASSNGAPMMLRISTDGGSTFKSGASDYSNVLTITDTTPSTTTSGSAAQTLMQVSGNMSNLAGMGASGKVLLMNAPSTSLRKHVQFVATTWDGNATPKENHTSGAGSYQTDTNAINALQFFPNAGTVTGQFRLYGRG